MISAPSGTEESWQVLQQHQARIENVTMRDLFEGDEQRFERMSFTAGELFVDLSKHRVTDETIRLLLDLARASGVLQMRDAMFDGAHINLSEDRAVLHVALRNRANTPMLVDGHDVMPEVNAVLEQMRSFSNAVRSGTWRGHSGKTITDVVNIGIGGSHLGPQMVVRALRPFTDPELRVQFVSNVDGAVIHDVLKDLDPERTLFLIASKTFTTLETMANARTARTWLTDALGDEAAVARHFVALSTSDEKVKEFGILPANIFPFWDWVGGRYSLWSAIGLSIAIAVGFERFEELLTGGHEIDQHFLNTPLERNVPVLMGLLGVWYGNFFGAQSTIVLPYDQSLEFLPSYLQQADMESNGKSVTREGEQLTWQTGPILWGSPGTDGQHAYYQLLHQGTKLAPADFLAPANPLHPLTHHHDILLANFLAQTEALMMGRDAHETRELLKQQGVKGERLALLTAAKTFPGNRPTTSILFPQLTPHVLGNIIALYEHLIFTQGVIWDVNSFDQMGVELGKELATRALDEVEAGHAKPGAHDASTTGLLDKLGELRGR